MAKLNDTRALATRPLEGNECRTVRSEKIDGGYIIEESYYNYGTGESRCRKEFSKSPPKLGHARSAESRGEDATGSRGLSDTMAYLASKGSPGE